MSIMSDGNTVGGEQQQTATQTGEQQQQSQQTQTGEQQQTAAAAQQTTQTGEWLPEAYRNDPAFGKFKNLDDLCKSQKHLQTLIGKKTVARPDENSSEEEWAEWYRDNGVPDDPKDYDLAAVNDLPQELFTDEMTKFYRDAFQKAHISGEAAKVLWQARNDYIKQEIAARESKLAAQRESGLAKFRQEWGDKYAANMNKAAAAFGKFFPGENIEESPLCDDPVFIRGMLRAYDAIKDDTMPTAASAPIASALSAVDDRISAIMNSPGYQNAQNPDHERLVAEMVELQRKRAALKNQVK